MTEARQKLQILDQRIAARVEEIRATRDWWPCRRGCDRCCRQLARPPELSACEWLRIDEAVAELPPRLRAEVQQRIDALLTKIAANSLDAPVVCPYLDENEGACLIYESRPIACRTYGFFVARAGDDYCQLVEAEVASRGDRELVWGNAEAIRAQMQLIDRTLISFEAHYRQEIDSD